MTHLRSTKITRISLNVRDLRGISAFYVDALGFVVETAAPTRAMLTLGAQKIELVQVSDATAYPTERAANDPWFQHCAIAVSDMDAAYARLSLFAFEPITRGGPQLLPPNTGSVAAYKFRDPEGHPIELSHAPGSHWSKGTDAAAKRVFLGIDHTALATSDLEASIAFYTGLGFRVGGRSLNQGPEQARLDGLDGAMVDIATLFTSDAGPHIELLHYRAPNPSAPRTIAPGDIAATRTTIQIAGDAAEHGNRSDPDGHLLHLTA